MNIDQLFDLSKDLMQIKEALRKSVEEINYWREKYLDDMEISREDDLSCEIRIRFMVTPTSEFDNDPEKLLQLCREICEERKKPIKITAGKINVGKTR